MSISVEYRRRSPSPQALRQNFVTADSIRGHEDFNIEMTGRIRSNMDNLESNERENASAVLNLSNQATVSPSPSVRELPFAIRPVLRRSLRMGEWRSRKLRSLDKDFSGYKHDFCTNLWPLHRMGLRTGMPSLPAPSFRPNFLWHDPPFSITQPRMAIV